MRILVVEDDPRLGPSLKKGLERNHYAVDLVTDGEDAAHMGITTPYDLIVLDVLLPHPMALRYAVVFVMRRRRCLFSC